MRIARIEIHNILGISDLDFEPGAVTVIEGGNDKGKTSVLKAIEAALGVSNDAMLLKKGEVEGRVVLVLDDGMTVTKSAKAGRKPTVSVKHPEFGLISQPQTYLDRLADALSVKPVEFLKAAPKQRAEYLLETLPVTITDEDLTAAGVETDMIPPPRANGLDRIAEAAKAVYDERTGVNRTMKEKRATISQLEGTLEGAAPEAADPQDEYAEAQDKVIELRDRLSNELNAIEAKTRDAQEALNRRIDRAVNEASALVAEKIATLKEDLAERTKRWEAERMEETTRIGTDAAGLFAGVRAQLEPQIAKEHDRVTAAKERLLRAAGDRKTREIIKGAYVTSAALEENSVELTKTLGRLEDLRLSALATLPIKGLEVRGGDIYVNDIPLDQVNKAAQVRIACEIAEIRAGDMGIICLDGLESLDAETFEAFEKWGEASGKQLVVSRVTAGPLKVKVSLSKERDKPVAAEVPAPKPTDAAELFPDEVPS